MFCKHCGTQIPDGSETCPSCGGVLTKNAAPKPEATAQAAAPQQAANAANTANAGASVKELARMLGGAQITDSTMENAREMMRQAENVKKEIA